MFWSVAISKPGNENRAVVNLERQGYTSYLPKYISMVGKSSKIKILFPRYLFVQIEGQWHSINSTFGISRIILGHDSTPAVVPNRIIDDLKMREDSKGFVSLPQPPKFAHGERVRVVKGALEGYTGLFDGMRPNDRVRVLIEMLGQVVPAELDERNLAPAVASNEEERV
jgi:transcriptional antiterminator RfaH